MLLFTLSNLSHHQLAIRKYRKLKLIQYLDNLFILISYSMYGCFIRTDSFLLSFVRKKHVLLFHFSEVAAYSFSVAPVQFVRK